MRGFFIILVAVAIFGSAGYLWYSSTQRPEALLQKAWQQVLVYPYASQIQLSFRTDDLDGSGSGFIPGPWISYTGSIDASDPSNIKAKGIVGYSKESQESDFQTADMIVDGEKVSVHLRDTDPNLTRWFADAASTSTESISETWFVFDQAVLLEEKELNAWIPFGKPKEIRSLLSEIGSTKGLFIVQSVEGFSYQNTSFYRYRISFDENTLATVLLSLQSVWKAKTPTEKDLAWSKRMAKGMSQGVWEVTLNRKTKSIASISAQWPQKDNENNLIGHGWIDWRIAGLGERKEAVIPENGIDITKAIIIDKQEGLQEAGERAQETPEEE